MIFKVRVPFKRYAGNLSCSMNRIPEHLLSWGGLMKDWIDYFANLIRRQVHNGSFHAFREFLTTFPSNFCKSVFSFNLAVNILKMLQHYVRGPWRIGKQFNVNLFQSLLISFGRLDRTKNVRFNLGKCWLLFWIVEDILPLFNGTKTGMTIMKFEFALSVLWFIHLYKY